MLYRVSTNEERVGNGLGRGVDGNSGEHVKKKTSTKLMNYGKDSSQPGTPTAAGEKQQKCSHLGQVFSCV
jgi:hypothetical protein